MNLPTSIPAPNHMTTSSSCPWCPHFLPCSTRVQQKQMTLWGFMQNHLPQPALNLLPEPSTPNNNTQLLHLQNNTPPATLMPNNVQLSVNMTPKQPEPAIPTPPHQSFLFHEHYNEPWGDIWSIRQPTQCFCVLSKNTGTINLNNLDMMAITSKLLSLGASIFAAQVTNVHWDLATTYQLYTQCQHIASQIQTVTSWSQEPSPEWYKPGGMMLLALDSWTSRIVKWGSDAPLGHWSYIKFMGQHNKCLIVVSAYHVCNQKFNAAANTTSAQQIQLLQANQWHCGPQNSDIFLTNIIHQIHQWCHNQKEIILCMDTNNPVNDPKPPSPIYSLKLI